MIREFHRRLGKVEAVVAATFLLIMVGLIFFAGIARLMAMPQNWTIDFATCLFAWACFLCADIAWRRDGLMSIDLFTERLSEKSKRILKHVNYVLICAFLCYIIHTGLSVSWVSRARAFQGIPWISYSWISMSLPVGAFFLLLTTLIKIADDLKSGGQPVGKES